MIDLKLDPRFVRAVLDAASLNGSRVPIEIWFNPGGHLPFSHRIKADGQQPRFHHRPFILTPSIQSY